MILSLGKALEASAASRLTALAQAHRFVLDAALLLTALAVLLASTLPNLANHPTITDDEMWVFSSAHKLAGEGVFGTDMFAGFFNAERRYYFNMPLHHLVMAGAHKLIGPSIVQARLPGIAYAVATLGLAYVLARRLYGVAGAALAIGLLLFLRLNMGFDTGLPLQELAVNMRYDLAPVPFMLGGALLLLGRASLPRAAAAGCLFGIATLMQFYGAFMFPIAAVFLALEALPAPRRLQLITATLAAGALAGLPYGIYILTDREAFAGQVGTIDRRGDFHRPSFYVDNLLREPERFLRPLAIKEVPRGADHELVSPRLLSLEETLQRRPSAKLGVLVGVPLALAFLWRRTLCLKLRADRLMLLCLGGLILQYSLLESAKFYIYWLPVVPFLCIALAGVLVAVFRSARSGTVQLAAAAAAAVMLLVFFGEGSVARINGMRTAPQATNYERLAERIHEYVPSGSRVVGSTSLWWGMRDTEYRSYFLFFYKTRPDAGEYRTTISGFLNEFQPQYIVLTRLAIGELEKHLSPRDYADWQAYMGERAHKVARIEGPVVIAAYGFIDIWQID
jgi:4-amino-4-deoxy-L-arabinose transferase-like glycosyltransferase